MIKPLLRVLPSLSGNVKIVCDLDDYNKVSSNNFECFVRKAKLSPLSSNLFNKFINISLLQSSYEWDLKTFFSYYSDYFWKTHFDYSKIDLPIYNKSGINKTRNTDFEFGAKRISYSKNDKQFAFFAPIYIDNINDIPDFFEITLNLKNGVYRSTKKIKILLNDKINNPQNYLYHYIEHYVKQIDDNVIYCLPNDKQATYWGVDIKNGGFVKTTDNTFNKLIKKQTTILNFDNVLCKGFERNNIVMRQILPLCFYFNINDILSETEKTKYQYSQIDLSGNWYKNGKILDYYDWDIDYTEYYQTIKKLNKNTGIMEYDYLTYYNDQNENVVLNIMDIDYPALNECKYDDYRFANKITPNFCRWKLKYSSDEHPYITNMNVAFSMNQNSLTHYKEFPLKYNNTAGLVKTLNINNHFYNNLILPLTTENKNIYLQYHKREYSEYLDIQNSFASNWFELMNPNSENPIKTCIIDNDNFVDVHDNKVYFNGILYDLQKIYDTYNNIPQIDKFGVFVSLEYNPISRKNLDKFMYADNVIYKQFGKYIKNENTFINDNILTDSDTQLYSRLNTSLKTDEIAKNNIFTINEQNTGDFINLSDFNIDYYELNDYIKIDELINIFGDNNSFIPKNKNEKIVSRYEYIPIQKLSHIINDQNGNFIINYKELGSNILFCSSRKNDSVIEFDHNILSNYDKNELNTLSFYQKDNFISKKDYKDFLTEEKKQRPQNFSDDIDTILNTVANNCYHYLWNPILCDNASITYAKNCFTKTEGLNSRFYGDSIKLENLKFDHDVLYIDPFNYNNIVKHYNNTWLNKSSEKFSYIDITEKSNEKDLSLYHYINGIDKIIDYIIENGYILYDNFDERYIHNDIKNKTIKWQLDVKQIIGENYRGETNNINNTALSTSSINSFKTPKDWLRFWFLNGWFPIGGYINGYVKHNSDILSNQCIKVLSEKILSDEFSIYGWQKGIVDDDVCEYFANTYITNVNNEKLQLKISISDYNGNRIDYTDDVTYNKLMEITSDFTPLSWVKNWKNGICLSQNFNTPESSIGHFNSHLRHAGLMDKVNITNEVETSDNSHILDWYGKFLNKAHLEYYLSFIYDDPDASGKRLKESVKDIYIRKRFLYDNKNLKVHDFYIPLSEYFNFRNLNEISDSDYNQLINDITSCIEYDEINNYFYFNTFNISSDKTKILKFNYDEILDGTEKNNIINEQFLDDITHLIHKENLGKIESKHFKFDLCFKKKFVKINKEIYKLINLEEELEAPYKDLYIYEFEKDFEYNNNCKIYQFLDSKITSQLKDISKEPFFKYNSNDRECLKPLFNNIFMEDKEETKIYCEYNLDNLEKNIKIIDEFGNIIDTLVRHNKNDSSCMFDLSSFNLDAKEDVSKQKPIYIQDKVYFTYSYWSKYLNEEDKNRYAYIYPTYDKYEAKKTQFNKFALSSKQTYYYSENITKYKDIISYTYYTVNAWKNLDELERPTVYETFFDNENLMTVYSTWRTITEKYEEIEIKQGIKSYDHYLDDLELFDSFNLNSYSYIDVNTGEVTNYAFYLINVDINNTSSNLNIVKDKDEYIKFIDLINGKDASKKEYIYDFYKQILPFSKSNPLTLLFSTENLMIIPKYYSIPIQYVSNTYFDKENEIHHSIDFIQKPVDTVVLERYFDNITPLISKRDSFNAYTLKYKDVNKSFKFSYHVNEVIYKDNLSIFNYPGVPIIDVNTNNEIRKEFDLEYKHFNDNRVFNLPESFEIEIENNLTYIDLLIAQTEAKTIEQFKKYINQHSKNQFVDDQILFLFNRYKVDYLHNCEGLTLDLDAKLYKLVYRFTLL